MELPRNEFKRAIRSGSTPIGTWHMSGSPAVAEAQGCAGFDFVVIDMEHAPIDPPQLVDLLRALAVTRTPGVVRTPWNDMVMVKRALDAGAQTLMLPFVQTADEARQAVAYTRYPPEGVRGVAGMNRGAGFGTIAGYHRHAAEELCVIVQVETITALERLEEIATVPGVDSIFIGPFDLSASMGLLGQLDAPEVRQRLAFGAQECRRLGIPCGIIGDTPERVARFLDFGYSWAAIDTDLGMMLGRATELLARLRAVPARVAGPQGAG
jgi:4-hydroxy-2-oxoheptanedioate aldolase